MKKIAIFGVSGFASEVADICDALGYTDIVLISKDDGVDVYNGISVVAERYVNDLQGQGYEFSIGVAEPRLRKRLADTYHDLPFANLIHPDTSFGRSQKQRLESSKGLVLGAGTRFMNSICIESFVVISLNCTIGHDVELGSYVSIMPGVNISGNVVLDEGCYIGSGAVVLQGQPNDKLSLGRYTIVGAGAVVTKSHNDEQVLVGIPAKALKIDL